MATQTLRVYCFTTRHHAILRIEKGHDIDAACGQLRLKQETEEGIIALAAAK